MDIQNFDLELPSYNGTYEAGLALGSDGSLPLDKRLMCTPLDSDDETTKKKISGLYAVAGAQAARRARLEDAQMRTFCAIAAKTCHECGFFCSDDGDTTPSNPVANGASWNEDPDYKLVENEKDKFSDKNITRCVLSIITASKICWWTCNHHLGGTNGMLSGYVKKVACKELVAANFVQSERNVQGGWVTAIHMVAHWCSTRAVVEHIGIGIEKRYITVGGQQVHYDSLRSSAERRAFCDSVGAKNVVAFTPYNKKSSSQISLGEDVMLRVSSRPAGTAKIAIVNAVLKKVATSNFIVLWPNLSGTVNDISQFLAQDKRTIHMGAQYLVNVTRQWDDSVGASHVGTAGTFCETMFPKSTMIQSPILRNFESYEDYDLSLREVLRSLTTFGKITKQDTEVFKRVLGLKSTKLADKDVFEHLSQVLKVSCPVAENYSRFNVALGAESAPSSRRSSTDSVLPDGKDNVDFGGKNKASTAAKPREHDLQHTDLTDKFDALTMETTLHGHVGTVEDEVARITSAINSTLESAKDEKWYKAVRSNVKNMARKTPKTDSLLKEIRRKLGSAENMYHQMTHIVQTILDKYNAGEDPVFHEGSEFASDDLSQTQVSAIWTIVLSEHPEYLSCKQSHAEKSIAQYEEDSSEDHQDLS